MVGAALREGFKGVVTFATAGGGERFGMDCVASTASRFVGVEATETGVGLCESFWARWMEGEAMGFDVFSGAGVTWRVWPLPPEVPVPPKPTFET